MLIVAITACAAIDDIVIRVIKVGRACEDRLSPELIRIANDSSDQNNGYIIRWPAGKETLPCFGPCVGLHRQAEVLIIVTVSLSKQL